MEGLSTKEDVISLADTIQQCAARIRDTFGSSLNMDIDHDGKVAFVFYPANDLAAGFFTPQDFTDNKMDMLNITTRTNGSSGSAAINNNLGTVVHEWQHLINYSRTGSTLGFSENDNEQQYGSRNYTWLNEAFSQNSMRINGYTGMVNTQTLESTVYLQNYNYSLTQPFVFQGLYVPQKHPLIVGVYVYWYLFGAYLASQTEGYPGGGNEIYNTVLSAVQDDVVNPDTGIDYGLLGKCDNDTLEKALTDIGYLGTGENAKAKNFDELIRSFSIPPMSIQLRKALRSFRADIRHALRRFRAAALPLMKMLPARTSSTMESLSAQLQTRLFRASADKTAIQQIPSW